MTLLRRRRARITAAVAAFATITLVPGLSTLPDTADAAPGAATASRLASLADSTGSTDSTDSPALDPRSLADPVAGLLDVDRRGTALPSVLQRHAAARLGASDLRWNQFGTPASILPSGRYLAKTSSSNAVAAARHYLAQHAAVFGLSVARIDALQLVNDQRMVSSDGHAVLFRQRFGSLTPSLDSMVTVGVAHGEIDYVSSSLTKTTQSVAAPTITPLAGWLKAAQNVGLGLSGSDVAQIATSVSDGWTRLHVPGIPQEQQARTRALAMADGSVRPVIETNVVDVAGGNAEAYTVMVDARNGAILHRQNQVENEMGSSPYMGSITPTSCGPRHAIVLHDGKTKTITAVAAMLNSADDIVLTLTDSANKVLATSDNATSPEAATYSADAIPAGTYYAQVCPFSDPMVPITPPYTYSLNVSYSDQGTSAGDPTDANPRWRFFTANPTLDSPTQTPHNSVIGCWRLGSGCTAPAGRFRNVAAFGPWDTLPATGGVSTFTTSGNNAVTHEAWLNPLAPGGTEQAPVSPTRSYTTQFTDAWNNSECNPANLVPGGNDINASIGNLFVIHNEMHDWSYYLGFTERHYNLQTDNVGRGGVDGDFETGNGQAGALSGGQPTFEGRDNANQIALQDGIPGITNQYLFQPIAGAFYAPCTDGELDQGIVGHEYTHAISNRMVAGPDEGLTGAQAGAMGESWSDLDAAEFQFAHNYKNGGNTFAVGLYATGNRTVAIRDYSIDKNPLNYSDVAFDTPGLEVHADGEIWNGTNGEVRQALVQKWNKRFPYFDKALQLKCGQAGITKGLVRPQQCPGNRRWIQLLFDAFLLQQGGTSMLDARDAFIAADQMRFRGENRKVIWDAFSRRGMGKGAATKGTDDPQPTPSFASPTAANTAVRFKTSAPGQIFVGDYQARVTPIADTLAGTKLGSSASFTPGTYDMLYVGPKNGFKRFTMKVTGGGTKTMKVATTTNLASSHAGAKVIGATVGSLNAASLIDGTEDTNWGGVSSTNVDATHPFVSVDLAGKVHTIRTIAVSALLHPAPASATDVPLYRGDADPDSGSRFTALRRFAVQACVTGCAAPSATWRTVYVSKADAFPAVRPRPVSSDETLRMFPIKPTRAAALRLVALENQCTGFAGYAGELDNDPLNATDCKSASDRGTIVHAAEFQAFSSVFPRFTSAFRIDHPVLSPGVSKHHTKKHVKKHGTKHGTRHGRAR